jgi:hypothetical protein
MSTITKRLGYGGSAVVAGQQVLITSGGFSTQKNPSYLEPLLIPTDTTSRSKVLHADGVDAYSGELALDVSDSFLAVLSTSTLLGRRYSFSVGIHDGESQRVMPNCYVQSLSLSGSAGGLISASLNFMSASPDASGTVANNFIRDTQPPLGYWYSGNTNVKDWTLSFTQNASPVYTNKDTTAPKYIKVGLISYSLEVTTYEQIYEYDTISVSTKTFTLTGVSTGSGYNFQGVTDFGMYRHSFETAASASDGSGGVIIN